MTVQRTTTVQKAECAAYHQRHPRVTTLHPQAIVTATEMIWIRTEARTRTSTYTSRTLKRRIATTVTALQIRTATKLNRSQSRTSPATKAVPPVSDHIHLASSAPTPGVAACSRSPELTPEEMIFRQLLRQPHLLPVIRATRDRLHR